MYSSFALNYDRMSSKPRRYRKIREYLLKPYDDSLRHSYWTYLNFYKAYVPENAQHTWIRVRDMFRKKALLSAQLEGIQVVDPILNTPLAIQDAIEATKPIGDLEEDWYEYGEAS